MKKTKTKKQGKLITNNVIMEPHEYATINVFLCLSEDVELVRKSRTPHTRSPDIMMCGMLWEMKSPDGRSIRSVEHALRRAIHQSPNIIIDLRRIKSDNAASIKLLKKLFIELRSVRNLWIITKQTEIIKLKK